MMIICPAQVNRLQLQDADRLQHLGRMFLLMPQQKEASFSWLNDWFGDLLHIESTDPLQNVVLHEQYQVEIMPTFVVDLF